jgi:hypothetical protein
MKVVHEQKNMDERWMKRKSQLKVWWLKMINEWKLWMKYVTDGGKLDRWKMMTIKWMNWRQMNGKTRIVDGWMKHVDEWSENHRGCMDESNRNDWLKVDEWKLWMKDFEQVLMNS